MLSRLEPLVNYKIIAMFFNQSLRDKVFAIINLAQEKNLKIATAESCTGGLVSALFTEIAGSSKVFECGFATYSNAAKTKMLQVPKELLDEYGAVSIEVAVSMAQGAIKNSAANISVAITGIAGPEGGSPEKPIGLIYIAALNSKYPQHVVVHKFNFAGDRNQVRQASVIAALEELRKVILNN